MNTVQEWLTGFAICVQQADFEHGKDFFHPEVYCFGSRAGICASLEELVQNQWKAVWPNITDFRFDLDKLHTYIGEDELMACAMLPWTSTGYHRDGMSFDRRGRVTILLTRKSLTARWLAIHTHYSLFPGTSDVTTRG